MAQTTAAISQAGFKVEVSTNGSSWTDISGQACTVTEDGGDVKVGNQHTAYGSEAVVVSTNKTEPRTLTVKSLYTEEATEAWKVVRAQYVATTKTIYMRYSPKGGNPGDLQYTCAVGGVAAAVPIVSFVAPELDASAEDPAMFEFSVMTPGLLEATVAT